jgi:hypothetical protein
LESFDAATILSASGCFPYQSTGQNASVASPATSRICGYDG